MRSLALFLALSACATGAPVGFSSGTTWTIPLVDPTGGVLVTPVTINGKGPYLFAIDPDVLTLIVDEKVAGEAGTARDRGTQIHYIDKSDTSRQRFHVELHDLRVGTLSIERRVAMVVPAGTYAPGIHGVLGREIIADSLVFGFDRDRGVAYLMTQESFKPPPDAVTMSYELMTRQINDTGNALPGAPVMDDFQHAVPTPRRLVTTTIGDAKVSLHVNFQSLPSALRESLWAKAGLQPAAQQLVLVDEAGSKHTKDKLAIAPHVAVGAVTADNVVFVPHEDKRWADEIFDGELGLGFFDHYTVWANWDKRTLYLAPRRTIDARERISRWPTLAKCEHVGCVTVNLTDPLAGQPPPEGKPHPGVIVSIARDPSTTGIPLEVVIAATRAPGEPPLPQLRVVIPEHADRVMEHMHADFVGAHLDVVDASPYPRGCTVDSGCIELVHGR